MLSHKMDFNCCANRDGFSRIDSHILYFKVISRVHNREALLRTLGNMYNFDIIIIFLKFSHRQSHIVF